MRKFRISNTGTLIAFEAAARHESITHAAKELFLTESAVSRQIAMLETQLGVRLFARAKQRVTLTRAGRLYSTQVRRALEMLHRDTLSIIAHSGGGGHLELAVLPTFASQWLIPRLNDFKGRCPDIRINMGVRTEMFTFEETHFEAAIHFGKPAWPGASSDYLFSEEAVPVCSPRLLREPVKNARELLRHPLLHSTTRPDAWKEWFADQGVDDPVITHGVRYELYTMLIAGAAAGLGIALVPKFFVQGQLEKFGLMIPYQAASIPDSAYYLIYPTKNAHGGPLESFRGWLLEQAGNYASAVCSGMRAEGGGEGAPIPD